MCDVDQATGVDSDKLKQGEANRSGGRVQLWRNNLKMFRILYALLSSSAMRFFACQD